MNQCLIKVCLFLILAGVVCSTSAHDELQRKLQELSNTSDAQKRSELLIEIQDLQRQINSRSDLRNQEANQPGSPMLDTRNPNLHRDTYFYRGPVRNSNYQSPFLDHSWQRPYGNDTRFSEGRPVFSLNHPNPYVNETPGFTPPLQRNPYTNSTQYNPGRRYQNPGSQFLPPGAQFPPPFAGPGFGNWGPGIRPPYRGYPGYGGRPGYGGYPGFGGGFRPPWGNGFFPGGQNQPQRDQQASNLASFDARRRLENDLRNDPRFVAGDRLQVDIKRIDRVEHEQIQVTMTTRGGVTGQGVGLERIYLYSRDGAFLRELQQPLTGTPGSTGQMERYKVTNQQRFQIERFLTERGLNPYGDPLGTMYAGGDPLFNFQDGGNNKEDLRFNYILAKHPSLIQLFGIQKDQQVGIQPVQPVPLITE
ncbi:hypothetical protein HOF92_04360 [bacterium]|jgi:hypothetical protein|nr:hypothetical protein [bacterium]